MKLSQFRSNMNNLKRTIQDDINNKIKELVEENLEETFDAEQTPDGKPWKKRIVDKPWPINNHTGILKASRDVSVSSADSITVAYNVDYSQYVDAERPLLPTEFPQSKLELLQEYTKELIESGLKGR